MNPLTIIMSEGRSVFGQTHMCAKKLRLGLLLNSLSVPAWVDYVVRRIISEDAGEFVLVILNSEMDSLQRDKKRSILYPIFDWIDRKLFTKEPDPFGLNDISGLLESVPVIKVLPIRKVTVSFLGDADLRNIKNYQLDVLLKFGFESLSVENLDISKYGTWFYSHGERNGPPGFWDVVENQPETVSTLMAIGGSFSTAHVLYRSCFFTYPLSPARHRSYFFWAAASFLPRQIRLLQRLGYDGFLQEIEKFNTKPNIKLNAFEVPSNWVTILSLTKIAFRLIEEFLTRIFFLKQWFLLFGFKDEALNNLEIFEKMTPAKNTFFADPHIIQKAETYYVFVEEFSAVKGKGHISFIEIDETGHWKAPVKVLEKDYHLSYPFLFEWDGKNYMIPESRANRTIDLYECTTFPTEWKFKKCLIKNVSAVDTTLIYYFNKWWLFTGIAEHEGAAPNVELFLFFTDDIFSGNWISHPQNPIVSDVKRARPAGSIFFRDGRLIRPSQDCSKLYGYGFDLNEIVVLSESNYCEKKIMSVRPGWDKEILATHTFSTCNNLTVIDAFRYVWRMGNAGNRGS